MVIDALKQGRIDWVTMTSSATATNLYRLYGDLLNQSRIAALSPVTAQAAKDLGLNVDIVADPHTIDSLLDAFAYGVET